MHELDFAFSDMGSPLSGVRVIELASSLGAYCGRLLSDLGAEVTVVEPRPAARASEDHMSAEHLFFHAGKDVLAVSEDTIGPTLTGLLDDATVLITGMEPRALARYGLNPVEIRRRYPHLVHVSISPYGLDGPWADRPATDLTLLAAGGLLSLGGEPNRAPVRPVGEQTTIIAGLHATAGALIALLACDADGVGQTVDVSAQEAVAHSLENAAQYYDLEGVVRSRVGGTPREAGTGLFRCTDGWVYLVAGLGGSPLGWDGLIKWIGEEMGESVRDELQQPCWSDPTWRRSVEAIEAFRTTFEAFTASREKASLVDDGQAHGVSISPVATPVDLLENPQLVQRGFFRSFTSDGVEFTMPGAPYRMGGVDVGPRSAPRRRMAEV